MFHQWVSEIEPDVGFVGLIFVEIVSPGKGKNNKQSSLSPMFRSLVVVCISVGSMKLRMELLSTKKTESK